MSKEQQRRMIGSCFIPNEYFVKGTTKKMIFLRTLKKVLERTRDEHISIYGTRTR